MSTALAPAAAGAASTGAPPAAPRRRLAALTGRLPLSTRLVAALLALLAAGLLVSGLVGARSLRSYLLARVDTQLSQVVGDGPGGGLGGGLPVGLPQERGHARLNAYYVAYGTGDGALLGEVPTAQSPPDLPPLTTALATARAGRPFTVDARGGTGSWRVLVTPLQDGSGVAAVAVDLDDVQRTVHRLLLVDGIASVVVLGLLGGLALLLVRTSLRPLLRVEQTAAAIAAGDLSQRVPQGPLTTEVGQLARSLNAMLGQIEQSFAAQARSEAAARASEQRMRQFVADASHELRTPLTSIRGFAELYRAGAVVGEDGVPRVMRRVEGEAVRMGTLVDELLLLARLDQERPLAQDPVDLLVLASDAVHDARTWADGRPVGLVAADLAAPPVVRGDEPRLRQVLANLLRNAVVHTPAGTSVEVRLRVVGTDVELAVADDGPGLTPEQAGQVFDRFYRADGARTRAAGGSGLGLSIVASLVAAHGGTVTATGTPGAGAVFAVRLPLLVAAPGPAAALLPA